MRVEMYRWIAFSDPFLPPGTESNADTRLLAALLAVRGRYEEEIGNLREAEAIYAEAVAIYGFIPRLNDRALDIWHSGPEHLREAKLSLELDVGWVRVEKDGRATRPSYFGVKA